MMNPAGRRREIIEGATLRAWPWDAITTFDIRNSYVPDIGHLRLGAQLDSGSRHAIGNSVCGRMLNPSARPIPRAAVRGPRPGRHLTPVGAVSGVGRVMREQSKGTPGKKRPSAFEPGRPHSIESTLACGTFPTTRTTRPTPAPPVFNLAAGRGSPLTHLAG